MNYPLISEYVEAIKLAEDNFEELSYLRPVLDAEGQPVMSRGNFAVVFKMDAFNRISERSPSNEMWQKAKPLWKGEEVKSFWAAAKHGLERIILNDK